MESTTGYTFTSRMASFTSPGTDRRDRRLLVSPQKDTVSNVESQVLHLITCLVACLGIEPRPAACQADVLTTTLPRRACNTRSNGSTHISQSNLSADFSDGNSCILKHITGCSSFMEILHTFALVLKIPIFSAFFLSNTHFTFVY